jgi:hypothetical protein
VDDALCVGGIERLRRLREPCERLTPRDLLLPRALGEGPAGQILHDDEGTLPPLADVEDRDDMRMSREAGGGERLLA